MAKYALRITNSDLNVCLPARVLLEMEAESEAYTLDGDDLADGDEALEEIRRGEPGISEEEVRAVLDRYRA